MQDTVHSEERARILVAEADLRARHEHEMFFRGYGFDVTVCRTGREALAHLREPGIDVLLLELLLPEVSGYEVLAQMRMGQVQRVPAVVVAEGPVPFVSGANAVFPKPAPVIEVLAAVQRLLAR